MSERPRFSEQLKQVREVVRKFIYYIVLSESRKKELWQRTLRAESEVIGLLQQLFTESTDAKERLKAQAVLRHILSTPGLDPHLRIEVDGGPSHTTLERRARKLVEPLEENDSLYLSVLEAFILKHGHIGMLTQLIFLSDEEIPVSYDMAIFNLEGSWQRFTFILLEQIPTSETMDKLNEEMRDKGIISHFPDSVRLGQEGKSFSSGSVEEGTFQLFELWNTFDFKERQFFSFLSVTDEISKPKGGKRKKRTPQGQPEEEKRWVPGFMPGHLPVRS